MSLTVERITEVKTVSRSFRLSPKTGEDTDLPAEEIVISWQQVDERPPQVVVTAPTGPEGWHMPVPQRPGWLITLITTQAPDWWMQ
ncbi:hypothetical protein ACIQMV_19380 [Streptomyces sp. NPDC091412]|uniref:hypothetical protein n=1 Tax=Streptomyces sp. NPDC091412 TaxID=3366002 RepID=UPI00381D6D28